MTATDVPSTSSAISKVPNFQDLSARCPSCGAHVTYTDQSSLIAPGKFAFVNGTKVERVIASRCPGCKGLVLAAGHPVALRLLWPLEGWPDGAPSDLAPEIKQAYDEARQVLPLSPQAAAVLARRCLQHVIRTKLNIKKKTLFQEIAEAITRDDLSKLTRDELDHVRTIGNWGAHPVEDGADPAATIIEVSREEAEYTLKVLEDLFEDLYTRPARAAAMKAKIAPRG